MSQEVRDMIADSANFFWGAESQQNDIRNDDITETYLISILQTLHDKGWYIGITSVCSDHSDDSDLGEHCHSNGYCVDLWPLNTPNAGDWMDANAPAFADFLMDIANADYLHQIGLAGTAVTPVNLAAAGPTAFVDEGADHIHVGATEVQ